MKKKMRSFLSILILVCSFAAPAMAAETDADNGFGMGSEYLEKAEAGKPVRKSPAFHITCSIGGALFLAFIVCMIQKSKMKTVHKKTEATTYATGDVTLTEHYDRFTHTTKTRRKIEKDSGTSHSESGGRSGKF